MNNMMPLSLLSYPLKHNDHVQPAIFKTDISLVLIFFDPFFFSFPFRLQIHYVMSL